MREETDLRTDPGESLGEEPVEVVSERYTKILVFEMIKMGVLRIDVVI